jgi:hypothetical protein
MLWITVFADKSEGGEWFLQENLSNVCTAADATVQHKATD